QLRLFRFDDPQDPARAHHGKRSATARLSCGRSGRRALLGRRARLEHAAAMGSVGRYAPGHACFPSRPVERARRLAERSQRRDVATERNPVFEQDAGQHDHFKQIQCVRMALATLLEKIPTEILESDEGKLLRSAADRNVYQIVHLIYRSKNYEVQSKDYEFSRDSMIDHWNAGYNDAVRTLRHPEALQRPANDPGVATFDVVADGRE